jgi:glycine cleavage system H protein
MDNGMLADLQAAKAIEYMLALAFLVLFVPFWRYTVPRAAAPAPAPARMPAPAPRLAPSGWFHVPDGLGLHPGHAWAKALGAGDVLVGADDFARAVIGRLEDVELPEPGTIVRQGEPAFTLRGAAGPVPMISPVDGLVVATNPKARAGAVDLDPYGDGWLLRVHAPQFARNARGLLSGSAARSFLEDVAKRLRATLAPDLGPALADGGVPVDGIAREVGPEAWRRIAKEFFFVEGD